TVGLPTTGGAATKLVSRYRETAIGGAWTTGPESTSVVVGISGLKPGTQYDVEIAAANAAGTGPYTGTTGTTTAIEYMLDNLGITALAAYSLRSLRAAYAGQAIRVRRSSDDAQQDIGLTLYKTLDTASLLAFAGGGSAFVVTWYDQSGNGRNVTQATAGSQPRIVNAGVLDVTQANQPAIKFGAAGTVTRLAQASNGAIPVSAAFWTSICMRQPVTGTSNGGMMIGQADGGLLGIGLGLSAASESTAVRWIVFGADATPRTSTGGGPLTNGASHSIATNFTNSGPRGGDIWEDGTKRVSGATFSGTTQTATLLSIGGIGTPGSTGVFTGFLTEVIVGAGALSDANIAAIRTSQQGAWGAA
ncbi:MAG: hypothetical protein K2X46_06730, partial [Roseomonas sp.]|nr:hypothetical protein [Roseomonas sp.]